jgi:hypothetical protein
MTQETLQEARERIARERGTDMRRWLLAYLKITPGLYNDVWFKDQVAAALREYGSLVAAEERSKVVDRVARVLDENGAHLIAAGVRRALALPEPVQEKR